MTPISPIEEKIEEVKESEDEEESDLLPKRLDGRNKLICYMKSRSLVSTCHALEFWEKIHFNYI